MRPLLKRVGVSNILSRIVKLQLNKVEVDFLSTMLANTIDTNVK